jgi:hypothetical protein
MASMHDPHTRPRDHFERTQFAAVRWEGRRCVVSLNYVTLCGPAIDIRTDPEDPATSIVFEPRGHAGGQVSLWVKDEVPLGTAATIVDFCQLGGDVLCQRPTIVGGEG